MGKATAADELTGPKVGYDGEPPIFRPVRDPDGDGARELTSTMNVNVDRLEWLHDQKLLDDRQHAAGRRLQTDWQVSQLTAYTTASQVGGVNAAKLSVPDAKLDAMQRHGQALSPLGPRARTIVEYVIQKNCSLNKAAIAAGVRADRALPLLQDGLDVVAREYGL